jgi:F-type H+-transporting ATPase subunit b
VIAMRVARAIGATVLVGGWLLWAAPAIAAEGAADVRAVATEKAEHAAGEHQAADAEGHEDGHEEGIDAKKLILQFVNFGILLFILVKFGGKAVNKSLAARHEQLKADLAAAAEAKADAEARLRKQEQRMANLEREIAGIRAGIAQEAEAEKARLVAAAEERARRIKEETTFIIDQQIKEGEATLRREASQSALRIAEEILRRAMDGRDQQRMLDGFVDDVAGVEVPATQRTVT